MPTNKRQKDVGRKAKSTNIKSRKNGSRKSRVVANGQADRHESIEQIRRRHEKKQRQKKRKRRIAMTIIVTILLAVALCCVAFLTPFFLIDHVDVVGNRKVTGKEIKTVAAIDLGQNSFSLNLPQIEKRLTKLPYVKEADIKRQLPKGIKIHVTERQIYCYIKDGESYYAVDRDSMLLEQPKELDAHYFCVEGIAIKASKVGEKLIFKNPAQFRALVTLVDEAKSAKVASCISNIDVSNIDNITFLYDNKFAVNFGGVEEAERKIEYLVSVSKSEQRKGSIRFDMEDGKTYFAAY